MRFQSRVVAIPLALDLQLFADSASTYKIEDLDVHQLKELLPHAESLQLHWILDDVATNEIDWNIDAYPGWDRDHELPAVPFFGAGVGDQTTAGPQLAAITNVVAATHYMRHMRLQLKWRLHSGVTVPKSAKFSAILYVTTKGA